MTLISDPVTRDGYALAFNANWAGILEMAATCELEGLSA